MSTEANSAAITAIQLELAKTIRFSEMTNTAKRSINDELNPEGYALWYTDPKLVVGDKVFGWGDAAINGGGFFFGEITQLPVTEANLDLKVEL